jgi:uncharacterized membrane protein
LDTLRSRLGDGKRHSRRYALAHQPLLWAIAASSACVAVLLVWTATGSAGDASFMAVNLALAWIPVVMSYGIALAARTPIPLFAVLVMCAVWLLFLPNAPYLITDVVHVHSFSNRSPGLIAGGLGALAATGVVLFFTSVATVHKAAGLLLSDRAARWVPPVCAWTSGVGMYCGRFLRWNSWDVVVNPFGLVRHATTHLDGPAAVMAAIGFTVCCAVLLQAAYVLLSGWASPNAV